MSAIPTSTKTAYTTALAMTCSSVMGAARPLRFDCAGRHVMV
jgi:hypothetical protein